MVYRNKKKICPKCGRYYKGVPAISRRDNKQICPDCGMIGAMEDGGISADKQRAILDMIQKYPGRHGSEMEEERGEEENGKKILLCLIE